MNEKPRRVDFSPDNLIAGIAGQMDLEEFAVYWMVITLIYSKSGPIKNDPAWIAGIFRKVHPRTVKTILDRLVTMSKIERSDAELMVKRCRSEIEAASNRIRKARENGSKGGRKPHRETMEINNNKELDKPGGLFPPNQDRNLARDAPSPSPPPSPSVLSEGKPSGAKAPLDLKSVLFGECIVWLAKGNGKDPDKYRPLVGRWLRDFGEQAVYGAFRSAQKESPVEPVGYIERILKPDRGRKPQI